MKKKVLPLWQITFDPLKNGLKNIHQWSKTCFFFHQKSEGIAFTFCRYLYQNMRAFIFCRYCPPIVFCPQIWKTKKNQKWRAMTVYFWDEVFSLGMPSVCPHLTTVYSTNLISSTAHNFTVHNQYGVWYIELWSRPDQETIWDFWKDIVHDLDWCLVVNALLDFKKIPKLLFSLLLFCVADKPKFLTLAILDVKC